jgi:hypothetical protein
VYNSRQTVHRLGHVDDVNTPYLELEFPSGSLTSLSGSPLTDTDSVLVTVDPRPGGYGFTLSPSDLGIDPNAAPVATFFFGRYGDASVVNTTETYADPADYVDALDVWHEVTVEQWGVVDGSATVGLDVVSGSVKDAGRYVLAAPQ